MQWIAAVPALALVAAYLSRSTGGGAGRRTVKDLIVDAITMREVLVSYSTRREMFVLASMIGLIALIAVGLVWRRDLVRSSPAAALLAVVAAVLGALYWVVPTNVAGADS